MDEVHNVREDMDLLRSVDLIERYSELKQPDFKVATRYVDVEYCPDWGRLGECTDYFWETPEEKGLTGKEAQENPTWDPTLGPME